MDIDTHFKKTIWDFYKKNGRVLPWRNIKNPYRIFVSEIMLQQTQVSRVEKVYPNFIREFPSFQSLASAPLSHVLRAWHGMGYNRRALYLKKSSEKIIKEYKGRLPQDEQLLRTLPGIGEATAGSLIAFVFNTPSYFIETNIRRVFITFFFKGQSEISDRMIMQHVMRTCDTKNPREWYYALMDYGAMLGVKEKSNANTRAKIYRPQTKFKGSRRELRGKIITLLRKSGLTETQIIKKTDENKAHIQTTLQKLRSEGLLEKKGHLYQIPEA